MRVFHQIIFEGVIATDSSHSSTVYSYPEFNALLGSVQTLSVSGYFSNPSGSPIATLGLDGSVDNFNWSNQSILVLALSIPGETSFQSLDTGMGPTQKWKLPFVRVHVQLNAPSSQAFLRLWATGRDFSRRAASVGA